MSEIGEKTDLLCRVGIAFERSRMLNTTLLRALPTARVSVGG